MFGPRITLFRLFGVEVRLDASWIIIAALIIWSLATGVFPAMYPAMPQHTYWWMGVLGALGLFGSIVLHELAHSLVANHYKLPMKGITLFIFGGVAEMGGEPQNPKIEFRMAIAGPLASIAIGCIFWLIHDSTGWPGAVLGVLGYLAWINWALAGFNLIPAFPLDGGRVLRAAMWHFKGDFAKATKIASKAGSAFGFLLIVFAFYQLFYGNLFAAIWYCLIGSFLRGASRMSYEQMLLRSALEGEPVRRFMRPDPITVSPDISIRQLIENYVYRYNFKMYPVVGASHDLTGCVSMRDVKEVPKEEWDRHNVAEVLKPCTGANTISPDTGALEVLAKLRETGAGGLLVTEGNHLLSIVSQHDILNFLAAKMELEGRSLQLPDRSKL
jgi:Zn-dependent protease/CBS domain-containing protein